ncbi:hypothetical protein SCHIN_v1c05990 [Spiroplasma chinense]|uniref:Lipoprotein n=1 Tax=Spiroplasma chinense TaxID=216932 RepID=A0A5B9Y518_9MOLU|nr:lipoprotein [Spiroplasma chinense]QEH61796.1 hypothetical protein SCHIN_v1c05990 [Spiroplasma chinense]
MKKLLAFIGGISITTPTIINVVSCDSDDLGVLAPDQSDLMVLFADYETITIKNKSVEGIVKEITSLKFISSLQFEVAGDKNDNEIDFSQNFGTAHIIPRTFPGYQVIKEVTINWIYDDGSIPNLPDDKDNSLSTISELKDWTFNYQTSPDTSWEMAKGTVKGVFNTLVGEAFGIAPGDRQNLIREGFEYDFDFDEVVKNIEFKPGNKAIINIWTLKDSWFSGKTQVTIILN